MSSVTNSIGLRFERFTEQLFPELIRSEQEVVPDFRHPKQGFWIESKVGNIVWGVRIKRYQIEGFEGLEDPVIYALGLHNLDNAHGRIVQKTERGRQSFLERAMGIREVHFITRSVMEALWSKENRLNKKGTIEYCMIKRSALMNIYKNRIFRRDDIQFTPEDFYGIRLNNLIMSYPGKTSEFISVGMMLDQKTDGSFLDYLKEKGLS